MPERKGVPGVETAVRREQTELVEAAGRIELADLSDSRDVLDGVSDVGPAPEPRQDGEEHDPDDERDGQRRRTKVHLHRLPSAQQ
jgi:hypothetical protein